MDINILIIRFLVSVTASFGERELRNQHKFIHVEIFHTSQLYFFEIPDKWPLLMNGETRHHMGSEVDYLFLSCKKTYCMFLTLMEKLSVPLL